MLAVFELEKPPVIWRCTPRLRWHTDLVQQPPVLQQAWESSTGGTQWRTVPLHVGEDTQ